MFQDSLGGFENNQKEKPNIGNIDQSEQEYIAIEKQRIKSPEGAGPLHANFNKFEKALKIYNFEYLILI